MGKLFRERSYPLGSEQEIQYKGPVSRRLGRESGDRRLAGRTEAS